MTNDFGTNDVAVVLYIHGFGGDHQAYLPLPTSQSITLTLFKTKPE